MRGVALRRSSGETGQVEHEDSGGFAGGDVLVHVREEGVLELDAGHVLLRAVAAHHHLGGLSDVSTPL